MDNSNHRPLHPGRPYHPEPPRGPPAPSWVPSEHIHPQGPQAYPVQNHAPRPRAYHPPGRASTSLDSYQMGFGGGPSLPNPIPQGYTLPHPHGGLYLPHQGHWVSHSMQAPIPPNHGGMMNMSGGLSYELMPTPPAVGSGYPSQPPQGMGLHANTGLEANTQLQSRYIQQSGIIPMSYYVAPPPGHQIGQIGLDPYPAGSTTYNRRLGYTGSSASSRVPRAPNSYSPSSPPLYHDFSGPSPHRRSTHSSRARRSSLNTRPMASGLNRDTEEEGGHNSSAHRLDPVNYRTGQEPAVAVESIPTRPLRKILSMEQILQNSVGVKIEDLPEQDRTCVICYNEFYIESPEGIKESPRRLTKCKHVFGDKCLERWLEQSSRCPYCREILSTQLEHEFEARRARALLTVMRARARFAPGSLQETHSSLTTPATHDGEEVGEAQDAAMLDPPLHRSGGSDSSAVDGENTPSDSSSAPASPIRVPLRDVSRFAQWSSRAAQQRGAQERGHRRQRGSRNNLPPPQPLQSDGSTQSHATIPDANAGENESSQSLADAEHGLAQTLLAPATTAHNRNRPW